MGQLVGQFFASRSIVDFGGGRVRSFADLLRRGQARAAQGPGQEWRTAGNDAEELIVRFCAALWGQQTLIIDRISPIGEPLPDDSIPSVPRDVFPELDCPKHPAIGFKTSGSTGAPKLVVKSLANLLDEAIEHVKIFALHEKSKVVCLPPLYHMYGFLHGFIVPVLAGADLLLRSFTDLDPTDPVLQGGDHLIMTPAMWGRVRGLLDVSFATVVSSGSALSEEIEQDMARIKARREGLIFCEILGSTETGAIALRYPTRDKRSEFRLFPGVQWREEDQTSWIQTPYLHTTGGASQPWWPLDDAMTCTSAGVLTHYGRNDGVFKFGDKRYSLAAIENHLKELCGSDSCRCFFLVDPDHPKGGRLLAFVRGRPHRQLRLAYNRRFDEPFPKVFFIERWPQNELGKTTLGALCEVAGFDPMIWKQKEGSFHD